MKRHPHADELQPIWAGQPVVIAATGPSLTKEQLDLARAAGARIMVINDALFLEPRADAHYVCDLKWFGWHEGRRELQLFSGLRLTLENYELKRRWSNILCLQNAGHEGFADERWAICNGWNSGYQALHCAAHTAGNPIILIGYDMGRAADGRSHFFGSHPPEGEGSDYARIFIPAFNHIVKPLCDRKITVINATPGSRLNCFPKMPLELALKGYRPRRAPHVLTRPKTRIDFLGKRHI